MFAKILVAVDSSTISQRAFQAAVTLSQLTTARLLLVHVQSPIETAFPSQIFPYESPYPGVNTEAFGLQLERWQAIAAQGQQLGNPGQTLCELGKTWGANLIVVGRRGYTGLEEALAGSVSNYVVHHAHCPVLAIQDTPTPE